MKHTYFISTGKLSVMHTLWHYQQLEEGDFRGSEWTPYHYIKNLSIDKDKAIAEAKAYAEERGKDFTGIEDSPMFKKSEHFEVAGVEFKIIQTKNKKWMHIGTPTPEFWNLWREKKQELKDYGFSIVLNKKWNEKEPDKVSKWIVFHSINGLAREEVAK